nr:hypothetical protein [Hypnea edeniana]
MIKIILSPSVSWKFLPWTKISQKIFILQEKIYKFSKQCDQYKVHQLQDYIINSSDVKLFIIQKIINNLNRYYYKYNRKKYKVRDIEKFYIYQKLSDIRKYEKSIKIILEYIKQYLVYICIKPEWEARFEPMYKFKLNTLHNSCYLYKKAKFLSSYGKKRQKFHCCSLSISINRNTKYLLIPYFIKRIQSLQSIKRYISYWLNYQIIENSLNLKNIYYNFYTAIFNCLKILINYITLNGLEWYLMYTSSIFEKNNRIFKNIYILIDNNKYIKIYFTYSLLIEYKFHFIKIIYDILKSYYISYLYNHILYKNIYV